AVAGTAPLLASGGLAYMLNGRALSYRVKFDVSSVTADVQGYRTSILRVTPALQLLVPVAAGDRIALRLGPSLGMPVLRQTGDGATSSFGFGYGGLLLVMARVTDRAWLTAALEGGGELFRVDGRRTNRAVAGLSLGGAVGF
ncbi:MAG TPA: hypothetical protein VNO55_20225, partial [Polyangia bacterium]|nr:hypothetical protein [Polyangia bacterium]